MAKAAVVSNVPSFFLGCPAKPEDGSSSSHSSARPGVIGIFRKSPRLSADGRKRYVAPPPCVRQQHRQGMLILEKSFFGTRNENFQSVVRMDSSKESPNLCRTCTRHSLRGFSMNKQRSSKGFDSCYSGESARRRSYGSLFRQSRETVSRTAAGKKEPHVASSVVLPEEEIAEENFSEGILNTRDGRDGSNLLQSKLPSHPKLYRGQLNNGLRYIILPNKVPPNRFEAHLEMHVGSVDENENEQGIAHMIEHVTFLGSKKREKLLGTGARSNAYTDFHHTVFHVHSPTSAQGSAEPLLPVVLDALCEIAFKPKFLQSRIEKERKAILSELQMMNTIEYRVDCQLLQQLHSENMLGYRFPIGLEDQIKKWDADTIKAFHERWYFPANATLYIVGDIDSIVKTVQQIETVFSPVPVGVESSAATQTPSQVQVPKLQRFLGGAGDALDSSSPPQEPILKKRHAVRPPVEHQWSVPSPGVLKKPYIFQHELLQNFSLSIFCKDPVQKVSTFSDLREVLMRRIVVSAFQFRINARYKSADPPFTGIEWDYSDSGREACSVSTITIGAEPKYWKAAVKVAVQEARRLKEFGVTKGELARYLNAIIKDSEHMAAMIDNVPSIDNLDFIMESDALEHIIMNQQQGHECLLQVANSVNLEDVNVLAAALLDHIADFGRPSAPLPAAIVACVPKTNHQYGSGDVVFSISPDEIIAAFEEGLSETLSPEPELEVPKELVSSLQLTTLKLMRRPSFVPVKWGETSLIVRDHETGIIQRKLSNGIRVNYKITQNEAKGGVLRLVVAGGRAKETQEAIGAVAIGIRTLSEGGTVGSFLREQVELFCVSHLINCMLEADEEFICMDFRFTLRDGGMRATFQLLHMILEHNVWMEDALDRAKQLYLTYYRAMPKSLERATAYKLMRAMIPGDERFIEPSPYSIEQLTLPIVKDAVLKQLVTDNMEVSVVGDFSEEEIESCLLDYLGTVTASQTREDEHVAERPVIISPCPDPLLRNQKVLLKDTDERACAYIGGAAPNRWGFTYDGRDMNTLLEPVPASLSEEMAYSLAPPGVEVVREVEGNLCWKRQRHSLYSSVALTLLAEIINARLFTSVRDTLGLTYDVSFELSLFDRLKTGWFVISVTSTPGKIHKAVDASLSVLRGIEGSRINQRELDRAKRTLIMRHESDSKNNAYWLNLLTHLQAPSMGRKDVDCIREMIHLYETASVDDIYNAYNHLSLDDESVFTCIGIAGAETSQVIPASELLQDETDIIESEQSAGFVQHGRGLSTMTRPTM